MPGAIRRHLMMGLLVFAALGILLRAVYLQVFVKDFLQGQGDQRFVRELGVPAHRGMITDRHGEPLAVSSPVASIWVDPTVVISSLERLPELAQILDLELTALRDKLVRSAERQSEFVYLRRHLSPAQAEWVLRLKIPGVYKQTEYRRFYPTAEVSAHLLGFTNIDDIGQEGAEDAFNSLLQGVPGKKRVIRDRLDRIVEEVESLRLPRAGEQLVLSIDSRIQYLAYRALKATVQKYKAVGASAVVLDVASGEILAMVNQPAGNPNDGRQRIGSLFRNRAITDVFEPGSTLKPFAVAVGLESNAYAPETLIDTNPGRLKIGRNVVRDHRNYGIIDVTHVISKSSNVGVSKIARSLPAERLWSLFQDLGFGAPTDITLIGERSGQLSHYSDWSEFEYVTHAFGYGISMTALQLAQAYAVIAADGIKRPLSIVRRERAPEQEERVLSAKTARNLRAMMESVVSDKGTGSLAAVPGYRVAGKTGTARKVINGRYSRDRYVALFAGMAPTSQPRLAMVVVVDEPQGREYYGGEVAAPVFSKVMASALRLLNIAPDDVPEASFIAISSPQRTAGL